MSVKTDVIFLVERDSENEVFAFFPTLKYYTDNYPNVDTKNTMQCYSHIGQHSACHTSYANECKEATTEQFSDLARELIGLGYGLNLVNESPVNEYEQSAKHFLKQTGTTLSTKFKEHGRYNEDDAVTSRDIFICILKNDKHRFRFTFGQSLQRSTKTGGNPPTAYDVLACLQKSEIGTFNDFCGDFGYDTDSRKAYKTYKAVKREWENVKRLWTEDEIEKLQEIN